MTFVHHVPEWEPHPVRVSASGATVDGWTCVHVLENGRGKCGGNVIAQSESVGNHTCWVPEEGP